MMKTLKDLFNEEENGNLIRILLALKYDKYEWKELLPISYGNIFENVVDEFNRKTDIPIEIPFFILFQFLSAELLQRNINVKFYDYEGDEILIQPDIWLVLLAKAGCGKSFAFEKITNKIPELKKIYFNTSFFTDDDSYYIEVLKKHSNLLFVRDNFEFLYIKAREFSELSLYFDELYKCDKEGAISFLGIDTKWNLNKIIPIYDFFEGFASKFDYIIALSDKNKRMIDYPVWDISGLKWETQWNDLIDSIKFQNYIMDKRCPSVFESALKKGFIKSGIGHQRMFKYNQLHKAHKFALLYHLITGNGGKENIDVECYRWAAKVCCRLLADKIELLRNYGWEELKQL